MYVPGTLRKDSIAGIQFATGIWNFSMGEFVISTLSFAAATISSILLFVGPASALCFMCDLPRKQ